ncbi:hypothetical protein THAOC_09892 [Thalassiosira oceanica]|uniref:Uncharacterized protein n=1 Tax=Thalassiosira oceanica TaxID=159749 RepID=K0SU01_THAOC|nr:hypothetical protein THAOC_09892 [Thalassiosira oceanica]|eukprot:EJK68895.1 hypothetical protein THAOC_09892 [Thalassiosira oceanica]
MSGVFDLLGEDITAVNDPRNVENLGLAVMHKGLSFPECAISRHSRYLTTIRTKHASTRHLLAATTMITGPYRSRHHMITSATSRRSLRAADGLRRPSESRAFLASRSTIYLDDACGSSRDRWTCEKEIPMMRGRTGDPKTSAPISGNRGLTFMPSRRRPPAAVGKPSFAYFPVDYLPDDVWRPDEPTDLRERNLPNATSYEKSEDTLTNRRNPVNR